MSARSLVLTPEQTLRAPWRIVIFIAVSVAMYIVAITLAGSMQGMLGTPGARLILFSWASTIALLASTYVTLRWVDGASWDFVRLGARAARPRSFASGILMGALAIGVPSVVLLVTHELRAVPDAPGSWLNTAWLATLLLLPAALTEELLMRGYIFAVLRETMSWKWALIGTSIAFGLLHMSNPGADATAILLVIIAGFFLGAIVLVTESLYAAWMAHFAWNWTMAGALHTAVSGLGLATPNYRVIDSGPDWLTGGAWGPEGGIAAGLGMFVFLFYLFGRHLGRLEKMDG